MAPHSSTLAWKIPWTEGPGRLQSMGSLRVVSDPQRLHVHFSLSCIGEGNGNPLQCSCLENPRDGGAWWAAVSGVAQSRTRLKWQQQQQLQDLPKILLLNFINFTYKTIVPPTTRHDLDHSELLKHFVLFLFGSMFSIIAIHFSNFLYKNLKWNI